MTEATPMVCVAVQDLLTVIDLATCNPYMGDYTHDLTALRRLGDAIEQARAPHNSPQHSQRQDKP